MEPTSHTMTTEWSTGGATPGYPSLRQAWWLIIVLFLWQIPLSIPIGALTYFSKENDWNLYGLPELVVYVAAFVLTIRYGLRKRGNFQLALAPVKAVVFPVVAIGTVTLGLLIEPLTSALPTPSWMQQMLEELFSKDLIWSAVLAAPVVEEILLRGIILDGFLKRYSPTKAIVWSAAIFGIMHLNPVQTVGAFILGLALGWLYYRTRSLWPCIFLHFINNSIGSLGLLFEENLDMSRNYTRQWIGNDPLYMGVLLGAALITFGCYLFLNRLLPVQAAQPNKLSH